MIEYQESLTSGYTLDKINTYKNIQFENMDTDRLLKEILNDKSVVIGFCGTDNDFACTISAISAANYIAIGGYKVAVVEPDFSKGTILDQLIPSLLGKEMISCGNIDYYPAWKLTQDIFSVDVIIIDFSGMNNEESVYLNKMKKIILCSDNENMDIHQTNKLQNNSSFKYSIIFTDNSLKQNISSESEIIDVIKESSHELKRLLTITLLNYGIDIANNTDENSNNRINQLNKLIQAERSKENVIHIKPERKVKKTNSDSNKENYNLDKIPFPVQTSAQMHKPVSVLKSDSVINSFDTTIKVDSRNTVENHKNQLNVDTVKMPDVNSREIKNRLEDLKSPTSVSPLTYNREYVKIDDNPNPSASSKRSFLTNKIMGNAQNSIFSQKKEEKTPFHSQRFSRDNNPIEEDNKLTYQYDDGDVDSYEESSNEDYDDNSVNRYEDINNMNFEGDKKGRLKKRQSANQVLCGKETIFITGLKHGCGCSHTGISFAKFILGAYDENLCICHKKGAYDLEDKDITEYTKDTDYDSVFGTNRFIIYDCGILGELNTDQLIELKRCNIKIIVCNGDEKYLGNLSKFIRTLGNSSSEWIFAFNLVTSKEKEAIIRKIMQGYKICFIPLHDCDSLPKKVTKMWDSVLKRNLL